MKNHRAFSLLELLVVIVILMILSALAVPAINSILNANRVTSLASKLTALLEQARVTAAGSQRVVAVRFYSSTNNDSSFAGLRLYEVVQKWSNSVCTLSTNALTRQINFEDPIQVSGALSSVFNDTNVAAGSQGSLNYREFYVFPNGSYLLSRATPNPWLTVVSRYDEQQSGAQPKNPVVISIDPVTGRLTPFRR